MTDTGDDATPGFVSKCNPELRSASHVDYAGVADAKMDVLRALFRQFGREHLAADTARAAEFRGWWGRRGNRLLIFATWEALREHQARPATDHDRSELRDPVREEPAPDVDGEPPGVVKGREGPEGHAVGEEEEERRNAQRESEGERQHPDP